MLVNRGGGGSGMFAIQLARGPACYVTAVDNAGKLDFMRSLGADEVVDYRAEDPFDAGAAYDLILDLVAHRSVFAYRPGPGSGRTLQVVGRHHAHAAARAPGRPGRPGHGRRLGVLGCDRGRSAAPASGAVRSSSLPLPRRGVRPRRRTRSAGAGRRRPGPRQGGRPARSGLSSRPVLFA
ncbi:MAG: hypothetical protein R2734_12570 [Nocardioides sp.]